MRRLIVVLGVLVFAAALFSPAGADELSELREHVRKSTIGFKDLKGTVVVVESNRRELEKMGKVFAETYQIKTASLSFKSPDKLKMTGKLGMMYVEFITDGHRRLIRIPSLRYKKKEDISASPQVYVTAIDVGIVSERIWEIYKVKLVKTEKSEAGDKVYVLHLQVTGSMKSQMIWVDAKTLKLLKRDRLNDDGTLKVRTVYSEHKAVDGVSVPTRVDVYNVDGKFAARTEMKDAQVNTGIEDKEFE